MPDTNLTKVEILRTNGQREEHAIPHRGSDLLHWIYGRIGAELTDTVNLRDGRVMIVDDRGYETDTIDHGTHIELKCTKPLKPVNAAATQIYHSVCRPGTTHQIVGDVAITLDRNFE